MMDLLNCRLLSFAVELDSLDEMDQMGVYQFLDIFTVEITW